MRAIKKQTMLDLIIEAERTDPETGSFAEWLAEYLAEHLPTLTPPNEPLTLEELREMDGEPVWIAPAKSAGKIPSRWTLYSGMSKSLDCTDVYVFATASGIAQGYKANGYGNTWLAYRRPPEGEEATP